MTSLKDCISSSRSVNSMSQLEKVLWKSESVPVNIWGSLNIPEVAVPPKHLPLMDSISLTVDEPLTADESLSTDEPLSADQQAFSPTFSEDSGRWTGMALWSSSKYFVHGGPGFSIGILDSTSGMVECLPVPFPTLSLLDTLDATNNFSISEVTSLSLAGEAQIWAGTEAGTLHVFELSPGPRLTKHGYSKLPDPISCLRTDQQAVSRDTHLYRRQNGTKIIPARTEILVGSANGNLTVISGEADERGGLLHVNNCPRKVIQLGGGQKYCKVQSIALVSMLNSEDSYWCGCGSRIIILYRSSWKVLAKLDALIGFPQNSPSSSPVDGGGRHASISYLQVRHLESTDHGVWSSMEHSPAMVLWDTQHFTPKLKISCL